VVLVLKRVEKVERAVLEAPPVLAGRDATTVDSAAASGAAAGNEDRAAAASAA